MSTEVENVKPYHAEEAKKHQIEQMFDNIASKYDFLNHLLSVGIDVTWRRRAIEELRSIAPKQILDMATGTGDFAFEALRLSPDLVIGVDLSQQMLNVGKEKALKRKQSHLIQFVKGDSEALSYPDHSFDAITVGFGVRNFENLDRGLAELHRVLRPGGKIVILEPSFPPNPIIRALFTLHFRYITPIVGRLLSSDPSAYTYLPDSVSAFPQGQQFCDRLARSGFVDTKFIYLTFGICTLFVGSKSSND